MTKDEALKMAYDWLNEYAPDEVVQACKEALEQPTLTYEDGFAHGYEAHRAEQALEQPAQKVKVLYEKNGIQTCEILPAPSWQGLSDDEIAKVFDDIGVSTTNRKIYRAIEQALKDKNT